MEEIVAYPQEEKIIVYYVGPVAKVIFKRLCYSLSEKVSIKWYPSKGCYTNVRGRNHNSLLDILACEDSMKKQLKLQFATYNSYYYVFKIYVFIVPYTI